jgi:mRNA interferase MazF
MKTREDVEFRRGDEVWLNGDPSVGAEPRKTRTCVVVSNDIANRFGQTVTVVPTQSYMKERAGRAYVVDLRTPASTLRDARVANGSMITTYDRSRVVSRAGKLSVAAMKQLEVALAIHLGLDEGTFR